MNVPEREALRVGRGIASVFRIDGGLGGQREREKESLLAIPFFAFCQLVINALVDDRHRPCFLQREGDGYRSSAHRSSIVERCGAGFVCPARACVKSGPF